MRLASGLLALTVLACGRTDTPAPISNSAANSQAQAPVATVDSANCQDGEPISYSDSIGQNEGRVIAELGESVFRSGKTLIISTRSGRDVALTDCAAIGFGYTRYALEGVLPSLDAFLIHDIAGEGDFYLLVSRRSGQIVNLAGRPVLSPDGVRFVVASMDLDAEFNPTELRIFRLDSDSISLEWSWELNRSTEPAWGPEDPVWESNDVVRFTQVVPNPDYTIDSPSRTKMLLRLHSNGWRMLADTAH